MIKPIVSVEKAVRFYTGSESIQEFLMNCREGLPYKKGNKANTESAIKLMDAGLVQKTPANPLYRGQNKRYLVEIFRDEINSFNGCIDRTLIGCEFMYPWFCSTSVCENSAIEQHVHRHGNDGMLLIIDVNDVNCCYDVRPITAYGSGTGFDEKEILLNRNLVFRIEDIKTFNGVLTMQLKVLRRGGSKCSTLNTK